MLVTLLNSNGIFSVLNGKETLEIIGVMSAVSAATYCAFRGYMVDKIIG